MTTNPNVIIKEGPSADQFAQVEQLLRHFEELEKQFDRVREGLTHSHRLATLGTIASIIAHEYNNILTPVITYAQMALSKPGDHKLMRQAVEKGLSGAERAAKISSSLLGFAREADQAHAANVKEVVDDAIACLGRHPSKDGIELTLDVPNTQVAISPLNLQQVLLNLLLNARKAMRRKGGRLTVSGRIEGEMVHLDVIDTGPGIPQEIQDRLFEPFVTCRHEQDDGGTRGTGLGLCICRDLIRAAGGCIAAESEPGRGAAFHLVIPKACDLFETT